MTGSMTEAQMLGGIWLAGWLFLLARADIRYGLLYDRYILVVAVSAAYPWENGLVTAEDALLGSALGSGFLMWLRLMSRGGVGWGDVKLMAAVGLWIGWQAMIPALWLAFILGGAVALALVVRSGTGMRTRMPFGPFLAAGSLWGYFCGSAGWQWYEALL